MKNVALANYLATGFVEVQGWCYQEVAKMVDLVDGLSATEITKQDVKNEQRQQLMNQDFALMDSFESSLHS